MHQTPHGTSCNLDSRQKQPVQSRALMRTRIPGVYTVEAALYVGQVRGASVGTGCQPKMKNKKRKKRRSLRGGRKVVSAGDVGAHLQKPLALMNDALILHRSWSGTPLSWPTG